MAKERTVSSPEAHRFENATRYERSDVPPALPFWLACLLAAFVAAVLIGISLGFPIADSQQFRGPLQRLPPAPRLQLDPASDLLRYRADKQKELDGPQPHSSAIQKAMVETARQGWGEPK